MLSHSLLTSGIQPVGGFKCFTFLYPNIHSSSAFAKKCLSSFSWVSPPFWGDSPGPHPPPAPSTQSVRVSAPILCVCCSAVCFCLRFDMCFCCSMCCLGSSPVTCHFLSLLSFPPFLVFTCFPLCFLLCVIGLCTYIVCFFGSLSVHLSLCPNPNLFS